LQQSPRCLWLCFCVKKKTGHGSLHAGISGSGKELLALVNLVVVPVISQRHIPVFVSGAIRVTPGKKLQVSFSNHGLFNRVIKSPGNIDGKG
jgi:hypothetical protein